MARKKRSNAPGGSATPRLCVLTGGPCAGKTALIEALAARGVPVVPEAASTADHPLPRRDADLDRFHRHLATHQLTRETEALSSAPRRVIFCDRGLGDPLGYMVHHGMVPSLQLTELFVQALSRYRVVFALELSPHYRRSTHRPEPRPVAMHIHRSIVRVYRHAGARLVRVPWGPLDWRLEQILSLARRRPAARLPEWIEGPDVGSR